MDSVFFSSVQLPSDGTSRECCGMHIGIVACGIVDNRLNKRFICRHTVIQPVDREIEVDHDRTIYAFGPLVNMRCGNRGGKVKHVNIEADGALAGIEPE